MLALIPLRDAMGVPGTLLLLLVGPVAVAVLGGLLPAIAASLVTFLLADWFYIAPDEQPPVRARRRRAGPGRVRRGVGAGERSSWTA